MSRFEQMTDRQVADAAYADLIADSAALLELDRRIPKSLTMSSRSVYEQIERNEQIQSEGDLMLLCIFEQGAAVLVVESGSIAANAKAALIESELIEPIDSADGFQLTNKGRNHCLASFG